MQITNKGIRTVLKTFLNFCLNMSILVTSQTK